MPWWKSLGPKTLRLVAWRLEQENLARAAERRQAQSAEPVSVLERSMHLRPQSWRVKGGAGGLVAINRVEMSSGAAETCFRGGSGAQRPAKGANRGIEEPWKAKARELQAVIKVKQVLSGRSWRRPIG